MALRPARIYRTPPKMPYTRQSKKVSKKAFITGVPGSKIALFEMGNKSGKFEKTLSLSVLEACCIRHNALEAARIAANAYLKKNLDPKDYFLKLLVYPHHVLRYHPLAGVAQADRYYSGMKKAFGRPIGTGALVKRNQSIMKLCVNEANLNIAKKSLWRAGMKIPVGFKVIVS